MQRVDNWQNSICFHIALKNSSVSFQTFPTFRASSVLTRRVPILCPEMPGPSWARRQGAPPPRYTILGGYNSKAAPSSVKRLAPPLAFATPPVPSTREGGFVLGKGFGWGSSTRRSDFVRGRGMKKASLGKGKPGKISIICTTTGWVLWRTEQGSRDYGRHHSTG